MRTGLIGAGRTWSLRAQSTHVSRCCRRGAALQDGPNLQSEIEDQDRCFRSRAADHDHVILRLFRFTEIVVAVVRNSFDNPGFAGPAAAHRTGEIYIDAGLQQAPDVVRMATRNGAAALGHETGELAAGRKADVILVETNSTMFTPLMPESVDRELVLFDDLIL